MNCNKQEYDQMKKNNELLQLTASIKKIYNVNADVTNDLINFD